MSVRDSSTMGIPRRDLIEKDRASELWAEFHALVVIDAEV